MLPHEVEALAVIRALYGAPVSYTGAGLTGSTVIAIRTDVDAEQYQGFSGKAGSLGFEIEYSSLPEEPRKGNLIVEASGDRWSVIDRDRAEQVKSWVLWVEVAKP